MQLFARLSRCLLRAGDRGNRPANPEAHEQLQLHFLPSRPIYVHRHSQCHILQHLSAVSPLHHTAIYFLCSSLLLCTELRRQREPESCCLPSMYMLNAVRSLSARTTWECLSGTPSTTQSLPSIPTSPDMCQRPLVTMKCLSSATIPTSTS